MVNVSIVVMKVADQRVIAGHITSIMMIFRLELHGISRSESWHGLVDLLLSLSDMAIRLKKSPCCI
jgi:hypothetical protein